MNSYILKIEKKFYAKDDVDARQIKNSILNELIATGDIQDSELTLIAVYENKPPRKVQGK